MSHAVPALIVVALLSAVAFAARWAARSRAFRRHTDAALTVARPLDGSHEDVPDMPLSEYARFARMVAPDQWANHPDDPTT